MNLHFRIFIFVSYLIGPWSYSKFAVGLMSETCRTLKKKKKNKKKIVKNYALSWKIVKSGAIQILYSCI